MEREAELNELRRQVGALRVQLGVHLPARPLPLPRQGAAAPAAGTGEAEQPRVLGLPRARSLPSRAPSAAVHHNVAAEPEKLRRAASAPSRMHFRGELEHEEDVEYDIDHGDDAVIIKARIRTVDGDLRLVPSLVLKTATLQRQLSTPRHQLAQGELIPALLSRLSVLESSSGCETVVVGLSPLPQVHDFSCMHTPVHVRGHGQGTAASSKVISAEAVAASIDSSSTVTVGGFNGSMHPELLSLALGARFAKEGAPTDLTLLFGVGQGNRRGRGLDALAQPGLLRRLVYSHLGTCPLLQGLVRDEQCEARPAERKHALFYTARTLNAASLE